MEAQAALATTDRVARERRLAQAAAGGRRFSGRLGRDLEVACRELSREIPEADHEGPAVWLAPRGPSKALLSVDPVTLCAAPEAPEGGFVWLRKANTEADKRARREIAALTKQAIQGGGYVIAALGLPRHTVLFSNMENMLHLTKIISPSAGEWLRKELSSDGETFAPRHPTKAHGTRLTMVHDTVFGAAVQLCQERKCRVVAVNAASAYHIGGGFTTGGRHALEEAMCVQSTLYDSLEFAARLGQEAQRSRAPEWSSPPLARGGREWHMHVPDDGVVLSPCVEVFRSGSDAGYRFERATTLLAAVVSVAMPNCNDRMSDSPVDAHPSLEGYRAQLHRKWRAVLSAAVHFAQAEVLVVPDAGCGVFRNPPSEVGAALARVLRGEFDGSLPEVVVAFPGGPAGEEFAQAALAVYEGREVPPASAASAVWPPVGSGRR